MPLCDDECAATFMWEPPPPLVHYTTEKKRPTQRTERCFKPKPRAAQRFGFKCALLKKQSRNESVCKIHEGKKRKTIYGEFKGQHRVIRVEWGRDGGAVILSTCLGVSLWFLKPNFMNEMRFFFPLSPSLILTPPLILPFSNRPPPPSLSFPLSILSPTRSSFFPFLLRSFLSFPHYLTVRVLFDLIVIISIISGGMYRAQCEDEAQSHS